MNLGSTEHKYTHLSKKLKGQLENANRPLPMFRVWRSVKKKEEKRLILKLCKTRAHMCREDVSII